MTLQAIFFDLDGVIRQWDPAVNVRIEQVAGLPTGTTLRIAFASDLLPLAITGLIRDEVWREQVAARIQQLFPSVDAAAVVAGWSASVGTVDADTLALVQQCRKRVRIWLLTNATSRLPADLKRLGLVGAFDGVINSSEVGYYKSQPEIYVAALEQAGVAAQDALFIDDTPAHVAAAIAVGMAGHVYLGAGALKDELQRHGVL